MILVPLCLIWLVSSPFVSGESEVVKFAACEENPGSCTVNEVRIDPCPEAEENKPCKVKRGKSATIEFDFTTQWNSTTAHGQVYSVTEDTVLPLLDMNTAACEHTTCPIQSSVRQKYSYSLPLAKKFPVGTYTIMWILRNPAKPESSSERCCFTTKIKLAK